MQDNLNAKFFWLVFPCISFSITPAYYHAGNSQATFPEFGGDNGYYVYIKISDKAHFNDL